MNKDTAKKVTNWNTEAINILAARMSLGKRYIKQIILDERTPVFADAVKKEYKLICHNLDALKTITKL